MLIKNVLVYTENHIFEPGEIAVSEGKITGVHLCSADGLGNDSQHTTKVITDDEIIDGEGCYAIPGLIDMHLHGAKGFDVCDATAEAIENILEYELSCGVTSAALATMTLPLERLCVVLKNAADYAGGSYRECLIGINMEGPFISAEKSGAQDERNILNCDAALANRFLKESGGLVKVMGLAPENGDYKSFINSVKDKVIVSLCHSNASYERASEAIKEGAGHIVHLFNGMSDFSHRAPGILAAAAENPDVTVELIADGLHVHPAAVRMAFKLFGADRVILISDSIRATGMGDGVYDLGGLDIAVKDGVARTVDGALAGSVSPLSKCLKTAVREMNIPLEDAVRAATENPAKRMGIFDKCGSISAGKNADIVLLDHDINVYKVFKHGKIC